MGQEQTPGLSASRNPDSDASSRPGEEAVREELSRVLASHEFRSSKRSQEFLKYVVDNTLSGHSDILKERVIGIEVFGRSPSYDPSDDATVRVKAGEVRKRLGLYYAGQGAPDPVRIELPGGTYVPEFHWAHLAPEPVAVPSDASDTESTHAAVVEQAASTAKTTSVPLRAIAAGLALAVVALVAILWVRTKPGNPVLEEFWSPVLEGSSPVSVCAAYVPDAYRRDPSAAQPVRAEDFTPVTDQFVGGGDLIAVSELTGMLARLQRPYRVRVGGDVSFNDLRTAPAILVGYSYTRWKEISSQLRYFIDTSRRPVGITDNGSPTQWLLPNLPADQRTNEDYAIVSRVFHPDTHAMLVEIAGVTQYGTQAGADLVTSGDLMSEALRGAPAGWQKKNMQLVLHVKVISGSPSSPKVVAAHFW
jgi:hypothetical protein